MWTGAPLSLRTLDIDHCLHWSAWPCGDLWNLVPATRNVNQRLKRDRLPTAAALATAQQHVMAWWREAWQANPALAARFNREVAAALPVPSQATLDDVFRGLEWRRLRLSQDQQLEEWAGVESTNTVAEDVDQLARLAGH